MLLGDDGVEVVAEDGEDHVPHARTDGGVEDEMAVVHLRQSRWDGDEVADAGDESSGDCCELAVIVEVSLTLLHLVLVEETEVPEATVRKAVDDRTAEVVTREVVERCPDIGTEGGEEDDEERVEVSARSVVGGRRHNEL